MIKLYGFPFSTNVERVAMALAHKKLDVEPVSVDPSDRSAVRDVSGQDLVPVLVDGKDVVTDSMEIVYFLDRRYPDDPLYPLDPARRAETHIFIDWFNRVWKRPPNEITEELRKIAPDQVRIKALGAELQRALGHFEAMLTGRPYLMGDAFSAADVAAFPFVKYAALRNEEDPYLFHHVLSEYQKPGETHPNLVAWINRCDAHPRAAFHG